jgi:tetratricopeptide (TPR) repeat protein
MVLPPVEAFPDAPAAMRWLRTQWPVAVSVMTRARDAGLLEPCWQLGFLLRGFFFREKLTEPWLRSGHVALSAAEQARARAWVGMLWNSLGMAHLERGEFTEAARCHQRAEQAMEAANDHIGATDARASLAWVRLYEGAYEQALADFGIALTAYQRQLRPRSECITLRGMALAAAWLGADADASAYLDRAVPLVQTPLDRAMTANCAAWVNFRAGRYEAAAADYAAAAELARPESAYELARALTGLGNIAATRGEEAAAARCWIEADAQPVILDGGIAAEAAVRRTLGAPPA